MHAKELVDFWVGHFKAHVEARCGLFVEPQRPGNMCHRCCVYISNGLEDGSPPQKRRKVTISSPKPHAEDIEDRSTLISENLGADQEATAPMDGSNQNDMFDFSYNIDGLTCLQPLFAVWH